MGECLVSDLITYWLVVGETGEYSDHQYWFVGASPSKAKAESQAAFLNGELRRRKIHFEDENTYEGREMAGRGMKNLDPQFSIDYTGCRYTVVEVGELELADLAITPETK